MTTPGFSSRSSGVTFHQFPQRDGAAVTDIAGMEPGFSNSEPADHAPEDVHPDVAPPPEHAPGFSNGDEVDEQPPPEPVEHAIVSEAATKANAEEPKAEEAAPAKTTARKTTARKTTAQKKG